MTNKDVSPGPEPRTVRYDGVVLNVPAGWALLPPGDATLTRRVKKAGPSWTVKEKKGRRTFSQGVWSDAATIDALRVALEAERDTPAYQKRLQKGRQRSAVKQANYVEDFTASVAAYLGFHPRHAQLQAQMALAISTHATPVGSGTVARTKRISIEQRASRATIAWMRHQTTAYDNMVIPRVKGARRETRRKLAKRSKRLLQGYRDGRAIPADCPLKKALTPPD